MFDIAAIFNSTCCQPTRLAVSKMDTAVPTETCLPLYLIAASSHFITINNERSANYTVWFRRSGQNLGSWSLGKCEKRRLCEHVTNSDWLQRLAIELFQTPDLIPLDFCFCICMQHEVYNRKIIKRDKFLARNVYAAASTEKSEDQIGRKRRDSRTLVA
jgi:hypothetical protein